MKFAKRCAAGLFCLCSVIPAGSLLAQETGIATDTADRPGNFKGQPLPEQNNNLQRLMY